MSDNKIYKDNSCLVSLIFTVFILILIKVLKQQEIIIIYTNNSWRDQTYIPYNSVPSPVLF